MSLSAQTLFAKVVCKSEIGFYFCFSSRNRAFFSFTLRRTIFVSGGKSTTINFLNALTYWQCAYIMIFNAQTHFLALSHRLRYHNSCLLMRKVGINGSKSVISREKELVSLIKRNFSILIFISPGFNGYAGFRSGAIRSVKSVALPVNRITTSRYPS